MICKKEFTISVTVAGGLTATHGEIVDTLVLPAAFSCSSGLLEAVSRAKSARMTAIPQVDAVNRLHKRPAPLMVFTCVEAVKRVLGLHRRLVFTPWQLYRHLLNDFYNKEIVYG